jgi:hypothetical protein
MEWYEMNEFSYLEDDILQALVYLVIAAAVVAVVDWTPDFYVCSRPEKRILDKNLLEIEIQYKSELY